MQNKIVNLIFKFQTTGQNVLNGLNSGVNKASESFNNLSKAAGTTLNKGVKATSDSVKNFGTATAKAAKDAKSLADVSGRANRAFTALGTRVSINREEFLAQNAAVKAYNKSLEESSSVANALERANLAAQAQGVTPQEAKEIANRAQDFSNSTKDSVRDVFNLTKGLKGLSSGDAISAFRGLISLTKVFRSGLAGAIITVGGLVSGIVGLVTAISGIGAAAVAVTRELRELIQRTGAAAEEARDLGFQLSQIAVNANLQDLQEALLNITERFGEASKDAGAIRDSFFALGFTLDEIISFSFEGPIEQFERFQEAINDAENASVALFRARELGAEDLARVLPLLTADPNIRAAASESADRLLIGDAEEQVKTINEIQFAGAELQQVLASVTAASATAFGPAIVNGTKALSSAISTSAKIVGTLLTPLVKITNQVAILIRRFTELAGYLVGDLFRAIDATASKLGDFFNSISLGETLSPLRNALQDFSTEAFIAGRKVAIQYRQGLINGGVEEEGGVFDRLTQARRSFLEKVIEADEAGNTERVIALREQYAQIASVVNNGEQLTLFERFLETGSTVDEIDEVKNALQRVALETKATSEALAKLSPGASVLNDTSDINILDRQLKQLRESLQSFEEESRETRGTLLFNDATTTEEFQLAVNAYLETRKDYQDAINRTQQELTLANLENEFNTSTINTRALATFDKQRARTLELQQDIFEIQKEFTGKIDDQLLQSIIARRRLYETEVNDRQANLEELSSRNQALNLDSLFNFNRTDALNQVSAVGEIYENVATEISEAAEAAFDGIISPEQFQIIKFQASEIEKLLIDETKKIVAANRAVLREDSLDFGELYRNDFSSVNNLSQTVSGITEEVSESRAKLFKAELNGVISADERSAALRRLAASEAAAKQRAVESFEFYNQQQNFQARDLSPLLNFDVSSVRNAERAINDLQQVIRNEELQIENRLRLGQIDPQEAQQLLNEASTLSDEVTARINARARQNLQSDVNGLVRLEDFFKLDGDTTLATIDKVTRDINEAADSQAQSILDFLFVNRNLLSDTQVSTLENALLEVRERAANAISDSNSIAENNQVPINLISSLFTENRPDLSQLGIAQDSFLQDIIAFGDGFRTNVLDNIGLINNAETLKLRFPALDIDFSSFDSAREAISALNQGRIEAISQSNAQVVKELGAQGITNLNEIREEQEKREEAINSFAKELGEKQIPLELSVKFAVKALGGIESVLSSINTLQQGAIDEIQSDISNRASQIADTQSRLREAIEIGDVNEVRSAQARLNGLVAVQKREEALARKKFEDNKKTQKALAIVNIASGVAAALGSGPPPLNFVQAGAVAAAGAVQLAAIERAQFQSSSGLGGAGSLGGNNLGNNTDLNNLSSGLTPEQLIERGQDSNDNKPRNVNVRVTLPNEGLMSPQQVRALIEEVNELSGDGQISNIIIQN